MKVKIKTKEQYRRLLKEIQKHNKAYFVRAKPLISDYEYDLLVKEAEAVEREHPEWVSTFSPTKQVGKSLSKGFKKVSHAVPMLSLANTYSMKELEDFFKRVEKWTGEKELAYCVELKMDGLAISVHYEKGKYVRALTRGDGKKGEDVTENVSTIRSLPLTLSLSNPPEHLEIRGEVYMPLSLFRKANLQRDEEGLEAWANPRNAAAGSLKLLDASEVKARQLDILFYGVAFDSSESIQSQFEVHQWMRSRGLPTFSKEDVLKATDKHQILKFIERVGKERDHFDFEIDGVVVKVDALSLQKELGATGKSPRFAVAYKFAPQQAETVIKDIVVQVGRTGVLTPVAELEPVFLAGSTIARATLHNEEEVERKDIRVLDTVLIEKGGDVIPKVVAVQLEKRPSHSKKWHMPKHCPVCGSPVIRQEEEVAVRCPNLDCGEQIFRRILFFASKDAMDIGHLGPKVLEQLFDKGLVKSITDIYTLRAEELALLEGFKEKSIENLLSSIEASKETTLPRLILSLGIKHVGEGVAELLASHAGDLETLAKMTVEELCEIEGIGEKVAEAVKAYFADKKNLKEIERLVDLGVRVSNEKAKRIKGHPFAGKTFVLTGTLEKYDRSEAAALIKERGGKVAGSVSKKTHYLLLGENPGSKYEEAKALKIPILSEKEFEFFLNVL